MDRDDPEFGYPYAPDDGRENPDAAASVARALAAQGAEVVAGDADDPAGLDQAFAGAYGAFCVTNFWEHFSPERELAQAANMARATRRAGMQHVVWSSLEDTRTIVPLGDARVPTLRDRYKVPHFDAKGEAEGIFASEAAPTSYLMAAFYWENLVYFGMGPRTGPDGNLVMALPLGGAALPGIATRPARRSWPARSIPNCSPLTRGWRPTPAGSPSSSAPERSDSTDQSARRPRRPFGARDAGNAGSSCAVDHQVGESPVSAPRQSSRPRPKELRLATMASHSTVRLRRPARGVAGSLRVAAA